MYPLHTPVCLTPAYINLCLIGQSRRSWIHTNKDTQIEDKFHSSPDFSLRDAEDQQSMKLSGQCSPQERLVESVDMVRYGDMKWDWKTALGKNRGEEEGSRQTDEGPSAPGKIDCASLGSFREGKKA